MAAKDYKICVSALTSTPYLAKVSKHYPNVMLDDRREISEGEILMLIDCYISNKCKDEEYKDGDVCFKSHIQEDKIIEIQLKDKPQGNSAEKTIKYRKMKKYIGTKQIEAEPMTMGEAYEKNLLQAGRVPNESEKTKAGYHVKSEGGYESWSPAEPFEKAYKVADTPLDRMSIEENELVDRVEKLYAFIRGEKFKELNSTTRAMLDVQYSIMSENLHVLRLLSTKIESKDGGCSGISFGSAIALLKSGFAIRRSGWNGKNLFVIKQVPAHIESDIIPKMQSLPQSAKDLILGGKGYIDYTSQCLIYNGNTGQADSWVPSISDVFADDWELVE